MFQTTNQKKMMPRMRKVKELSWGTKQLVIYGVRASRNFEAILARKMAGCETTHQNVLIISHKLL